ncbi:hypothetical protein Barb4_05501 [Bacteroidales bacterium Barb4]|nr:hypothetical protein Barb4_05501 [Bacteroidales bacterium Barb4]
MFNSSDTMSFFCEVFVMLLFKLSSTCSKPSNTSDDTFSAIIAINTRYIRLIIF